MLILFLYNSLSFVLLILFPILSLFAFLRRDRKIGLKWTWVSVCVNLWKADVWKDFLRNLGLFSALSVCLPTYLSLCLPACLSPHPPTYLFISLLTYFYHPVRVSVYVYLPIYLAYLCSCLSIYSFMSYCLFLLFSFYLPCSLSPFFLSPFFLPLIHLLSSFQLFSLVSSSSLVFSNSFTFLVCFFSSAFKLHHLGDFISGKLSDILPACLLGRNMDVR